MTYLYMLTMLLQIYIMPMIHPELRITYNDIENNLQNALDSLIAWCKCNGMLLNSSKTKIML